MRRDSLCLSLFTSTHTFILLIQANRVGYTRRTALRVRAVRRVSLPVPSEGQQRARENGQSRHEQHILKDHLNSWVVGRTCVLAHQPMFSHLFFLSHLSLHSSSSHSLSSRNLTPTLAFQVVIPSPSLLTFEFLPAKG